MRKFFKKILAFFLLTLYPFLCSSCERNNANDPEIVKTDTTNYDILNLGEIPIGLWVTPPPAYQTNEEYARIKACGINFVNGFSYYENSYSSILKVLDFCDNNNLKYFVNKSVVADDIIKYSRNSDASLLKKFIDGIKPYANHSAFAGELLMDEPSKNLFTAIAAFTMTFEKNYADKLWHINLFPSYAPGGYKASSYEDYINSWILTVSPKFLSFDSYPLLTNGGIIDDYFYNLDIVRAKSRFKKIPFWTFIQTLSIAGTPGVPDKREPSETDIRWQVWTNLAFGSKGIQYFCYWTPSSTTEQFGSALIDINGQKTVRYDYVKKINADILTIAKKLLNCHAEGVILTTKKNYSLYNPLYSFGQIDSVSGDESIAGCFQGQDGSKKLLITTLGPDKDANVILHLKNETGKVRIWRNNDYNDITIPNDTLNIYIKEGEAAFIEFLKENEVF